MSKVAKSGVKGIKHDTSRGKWCVEGRFNKISYTIGRYEMTATGLESAQQKLNNFNANPQKYIDDTANRKQARAAAKVQKEKQAAIVKKQAATTPCAGCYTGSGKMSGHHGRHKKIQSSTKKGKKGVHQRKKVEVCDGKGCGNTLCDACYGWLD